MENCKASRELPGLRFLVEGDWDFDLGQTVLVDYNDQDYTCVVDRYTLGGMVVRVTSWSQAI